ncbi:MAG: penicillin-binding protein 2 [Acidobacteriota bacterium]
MRVSDDWRQIVELNQANRILFARLRFFQIVILLVLSVFILRVWQITVARYSYYTELAERNQLRNITVLAPRGLIKDREGRILADNVNSFSLVLYRDKTDCIECTVDKLARGLGFDKNELLSVLEENRIVPSFRPVTLVEKLTLPQVSWVLARYRECPELDITEVPKRNYRYSSLASHIIGYVGRISPEELASPSYQDAKPGHTVGKNGVERVRNSQLMGQDGVRTVLVDSVGRIQEELKFQQPEKGSDITLSIDIDLQELAEQELGDRAGALVALNPENGEILALASMPGFDPNSFSSGISQEQWGALINDPDKPLLNRATGSVFAPGSIFKVILAVAGLETGLINEKTSVFCGGSINLYGRPFRCTSSHGEVRLKEALRHSCNIYFYLLGQEMGIDRIAEFSTRFGLGVPTGIDLPNEVSGLVPTSEWKKRVMGEPWYAGETISVSIGQGRINATPLQIARAIGIIATGKIPPVHVVKPPYPAEGEAPIPEAAFSPEHLEAVRKGMWSAVNDWGTGWRAKVDGFDVCGKTGTAQLISREVREKLSDEAKELFTHNAWFVGFAPLEKPEIVVAVIVQSGGGGGASAAPVAGKIFDAYYRKTRGMEPVPAAEPADENGAGSEEL